MVTTNSNHTRPIYPNLARGMALTGINQLWVADITYIRLELEFVYLAVILDVFFAARDWLGARPDTGRQVDHCSVADGIRQSLTGAPYNLVHHSDRGVQYASRDYTDLLKDRRITISMSRKGNPYDNAFCESFMKTLKYDEVHRQEYRDLAEARVSIEHFLERVYKWRAASLGARLRRPGGLRKRSQAGSRTARMKTSLRFIRHGGIYRSDVSSQLADQGRRAAFRTGPAPAKRTRRKFPVMPYSSSRRVPAGYSSTGCSPAVPVSASPARPS